MYKVLVKSNAADEFFRLLLTPENRTYFRNLYQEIEIIQAFGCSAFERENKVLRNKNVLTIHSHLIPTGVIIEYHKSNISFFEFDKLLLWEVFPAEDNEQLENNIHTAEEVKKKNVFFQIDIILYTGNVRTSSTDLKNSSESLQEAKNNCKIKYKQCNVFAFESEESLIESILEILIFKTFYKKNEITFQIDSLLIKKEKELQDIYYLYDFEMEFLNNQNGVLSSDQLYSICSWNNIASKPNIMEAFFDTLIESTIYESITDEIVKYYDKFIEDICIWDKEQDCKNLREKIKEELLRKRKILSENSVSTPKTKIEYKSQIYTDKILQFNKTISDFFSNDAKDILCSYISEKIMMYRGLLK